MIHRSLILFCLFLLTVIGGAADLPTVGYVPINGPIDGAKAAYFKRSLAEARERNLSHVVVHLTTPGGELQAGMQMLAAALDIPKDRPRLIAFVDDHSLSAGSLVAYGHDEVLVTSKAVLGDIGVITMSSDGKIEYLPEKIETVVRTLLRSAAQNRGWDQAKLVKMTARTQELYRFDVPGGKPEYVIEDDLGTWLSAHPAIKSESKVQVLGKDRLLSYTAREAVDAGMATALVADLDGVYTRLGVAKAAVIDLSPTRSEKVSWTLAAFAPLLAAAALLLVFLEFKMPSGGLWLILAAVCGVAFFVCQFYLDLASYLEVVLIVLGLALVVLELFALPLGGLLSITGAMLVVIGLVLSFMPNATKFNPGAIGWSDQLTHALWQSLVAVVVLSAGTVAAILALPRIAVRTGLADAAEIAGDAGYHHLGEQVGAVVGAQGVLLTAARPTGRARFAHGEIDVACNGSAEAGTTVTVLRVEGPTIHVSIQS